MCKKNDLPRWALSLIIVCSLVALLTPISDVDNDGGFDSLITEGLLLLPLISAIIERSARKDRIASARLPVPRIPARRFLQPPILA